MRTLLLSMLVVVAALTGCKKEDSIVQGKITYIGAISGIEYDANGAEVYLFMGAVGQTGSHYRKVTADGNGNYAFPGLMDGPWSVYATITVNGITYVGQGGPVEVDGKNSKTLNLILE